MAPTKKLRPIPPGEILRDALDEAGLTANAAALKMRIPNNRLSQILHGQRTITADTALRLARLFGASAQMWMNLQTRYDLEVAEDEWGERIEREVETLASASREVPKALAREMRLAALLAKKPRPPRPRLRSGAEKSGQENAPARA